MINPQIINELKVNIKFVNEFIDKKQEKDEYMSQIQIILHNLSECLVSVEHKYLTSSIVEDANKNVSNIKTNIQNGNWSSNDSYLGEIVKVIAYLNNCNGKPGLRGYQSAVKKNIAILEEQTKKLKEDIDAISGNAKEKSNELKTETDKLLANFKEKLTECENSLSQLKNNYINYEAEIKSDITKLKENNKQEKDSFEQARKDTLNLFEEKIKALTAEFEIQQKSRFEELQKEKESAITKLTEELNNYKNKKEEEIRVITEKATKQLNIVSNATFSDAYKKHADKANRAAAMWYIFTMLSLGALVAVSIFWFIKADYSSINYVSLIAKALGTISIAAIAKYCANQASRNKTISTKLRKIELQMLSFDAFVITLPEPIQIELKTELTRLFVNQKDWMSHDKNEIDIVEDYNKLLKKININKPEQKSEDEVS